MRYSLVIYYCLPGGRTRGTGGLAALICIHNRRDKGDEAVYAHL